jgi:colanic acid biosynthesis glycosyl transferase WcaI
MPPSVSIITSNFWPEQTGISQTVGEFAEYLSHRGIGIRVVTALPYYPQWEIWPDYRGRLWMEENRSGLRVLRSWHFVRQKPTTLTRILHEATLSFFALPNLLRSLSGSRRVYVASPDLSFAFHAALWCKLFRIPMTLVVKDVMPDAAVELGMMSNRLLISLSRMMARTAYRFADEIHTLGEGMRRRIAGELDDPEKIRIVPDTIDPDELAPVSFEQNEFRRRFVPAGVFAVLHTGNMGKKQDLNLVLRAADMLRSDPSIHFFVFGDGAAKEEFLAEHARLGLRNVSHHPLQDRWMLPHMLSGADAVLISQLPEVVDIVVPSKLLTALAAGSMVIAACAEESEAARMVRQSCGGVVIPASDEKALVAAIRDIRDGRVDVDQCRSRARRFAVDTFGRDNVYGRIAEQLRSDGSSDCSVAI